MHQPQRLFTSNIILKVDPTSASSSTYKIFLDPVVLLLLQLMVNPTSRPLVSGLQDNSN